MPYIVPSMVKFNIVLKHFPMAQIITILHPEIIYDHSNPQYYYNSIVDFHLIKDESDYKYQFMIKLYGIGEIG